MSTETFLRLWVRAPRMAIVRDGIRGENALEAHCHPAISSWLLALGSSVILASEPRAKSQEPLTYSRGNGVRLHPDRVPLVEVVVAQPCPQPLDDILRQPALRS